MKHTTKQFTWGRGLLAAAALVQGVQYAQAFALVHNELGGFSYAGGALAGLVVVGAVAYAGNALPRVKAKSARRWGMVLFVLALVLSPLVLTPVNYYGMDAGLRASIGGYAWALAGLLASMPEIALGLVALVDRQMMTLPATASDAASDAQRHPATLPAKASDAQRRSAKVLATLYRCECGFTDADRFKMSGHKGKCAVHQAAKAGQPIPVELPAGVTVHKVTRKEQP